MGSRTIKILSFTLLVCFFCSLMVGCFNFSKDEKYTKKIISKLKDNETFIVSEIFEFDFDRAYVISDNYIDGELIAQKHGLNISIEEVKETETENIRRIVFVDTEGEYVYEYQYSHSQLNAYEEGLIIYPYTKIEKSEMQWIDHAITFKFLSEEYY